jgi:glycosyltransferase involved in cell wall biosynthesis
MHTSRSRIFSAKSTICGIDWKSWNLRMAEIQNVHQLQVLAATENSIGNEVIALQAALRSWGFGSQIYAEEIAHSMRGRAQHYSHYRPSRRDLLILHCSTGSPLLDYVRRLHVPLILIYHNITPPEFLLGLSGGARERAYRGREMLPRLRRQTILAVADSEYNRSELIDMGFTRTRVLPVVVPDDLFRVPPDKAVLGRFEMDARVNLLFVGRVVPNKRQEDVIKSLFYYRKINPQARLFLVGSWSSRRYCDWLSQFAQRCGLADGVHLSGHVSIAELAAYYRLADIFVCMSEHEGFGVPLVEAMRFGVPIIAYASAAVPETLGGAGILIRQKDFPIVAELIHLLQTDVNLRKQVVACQHKRAQSFLPSRVIAAFEEMLHEVLPAVQSQ